MKLDIKNLLEFLDTPTSEDRQHASSVVGILGEDLNAAAYVHFRQGKVNVLDVNVTQGERGGKWLDRWIVDDDAKVLYQCEIKNWSASAIGGIALPINCSQETKMQVTQKYLQQLLKLFASDMKHPNGVTKVLLPMKRPRDERYADYQVKPLLIVWMPVTSDADTFSPLWVCTDLPSVGAFSNLEIFSVSLYLRSLLDKGQSTIELELPHAKRRLELLQTFIV